MTSGSSERCGTSTSAICTSTARSRGALVGIQPFGGFNMSGSNSKAGGPDYLRLFMEMKTVAQQDRVSGSLSAGSEIIGVLAN